MGQSAPPPTGISGSLQVINSIVDNDHDFNQLGSSVTATYSAIYGETLVPGTGNQIIPEDTIFQDQLAAPAEVFSYYLSPTTSLVNAGNQVVGIPTRDINGNPRQYNGSLDIGPVEYSIIFNRGDGNWNAPGKWNIDRIPHQHDVVTVIDESTVNITDAVCKSIIEIGEQGKVTVTPANQLDVKTTISNTHVDRLHIKASSENPNGTLIFQNLASNPVSATVEMYSMAYIDSILPDGDTDKLNWQYFGIPLRTLVAAPTFGGAYVRKFNETSGEYSKWEELAGTDTLVSFRGYEVVQPEAKTYVFQGILENGDITVPLSKSVVDYYSGQHVLANPYTAAIKVSDMTFGSNTEATVYIYHSGSYADWNVDKTHGRLGTGRGQYLAVPKNTAGEILPGGIPSMQGFVVRATANSGSVTIPYSSHTRNVSAQRVKSQEDCVLPHLTVQLHGNNTMDQVWLFHEPSSSKFFDNGWDGYKIINSNSASAAIYANEPAGDLQVNTINDFSNINLHFKEGIDEAYTIKIINKNVGELYPSLYLIDLYENKVTAIQSDTTYYSFTKGYANKSNNRFRITTNSEFDIVSNQLIHIYSTDQYHVVVQNLTEKNGHCAVYDISGRLLQQHVLQAGKYTSFDLDNYVGIVLVRAIAGNAVETGKLLIRR
ncbi:MAG: hypothetical protein BWY08_00675 [Bacteroidetes bacterium ADurb.Bin174]|nr:MAG: hypothetical protein BWY08_00675 [Bacteroidetes bacterium ADurb.Bin174]